MQMDLKLNVQEAHMSVCSGVHTQFPPLILAPVIKYEQITVLQNVCIV